MHPPDERGLQTEAAEPREGVGDRAAGGLHPVRHRVVERLAALLLDELHDPLLDPHPGQEVVIRFREHVDDGVADADNLVAFGHSVFSLKGQRSRIRQVGHIGLRALQT